MNMGLRASNQKIIANTNVNLELFFNVLIFLKVWTTMNVLVV